MSATTSAPRPTSNATAERIVGRVELLSDVVDVDVGVGLGEIVVDIEGLGVAALGEALGEALSAFRC